MIDKIRFRLDDPEFGFMSNFYPYPIEVDGKIWPTTEHYYQAQKTLDLEIQELIRQLPTPGQSKKAGRMLNLRPDWDSYKFEVMEIALRAKFRPGTKMAELLLMTEDLILIEEARWDPIWGSGPDGNGLNHLGRMLMTIRKELRNV